jgi:hypothetical protein
MANAPTSQANYPDFAPKTYKIATGWAIILYVCICLLMLLFSWLIVFSFLPPEKPGENLWLIGTSLVVDILLAWAMVETWKTRFTIGADGIAYSSSFYDRALAFGEIASFRLQGPYLVVESAAEGERNFKIPLAYLGNKDEIVEWFFTNYPNVDPDLAEVLERQSADEQRLGHAPEERAGKLARAQKVANGVNWAGGLATAWAWFFPQPYELALVAVIVAPLVALAVVATSSGLIRFDELKGSILPNVAIGAIAPGIALCWRAISDFIIFDYSINFWAFFVMATGILSVTILILEPGFRPKKTAVSYFLATATGLVMAFYGYGLVVTANCLADRSVPKIYPAKVVDKHSDSGSSSTYYLKLAPWGPQKITEDVTVGRELYQQASPGDQVQVSLQKGWLGIPWLVVAGGQ